jgi:8-oxo-dGTP diphosphatase
MTGVAVAAGVLLWRGTAAAPSFLVLRNARHGTWGFAKGHLEPGEDLLAGALRECGEETGVRLAAGDLLPGFADASHYRTPDGGRKRVVLFLAARPVAQEPVPSREHDALAWWTAGQAVAELPFEELKRSVVRAAERLRAEAAAATAR